MVGKGSEVVGEDFDVMGVGGEEVLELDCETAGGVEDDPPPSVILM